jgi:hypothetical protein
MDKKKKSLVDRGDGDFILNESGTSVKTDHVEGLPEERSDVAYEKNDEEPFIPEVADEQKDNTD